MKDNQNKKPTTKQIQRKANNWLKMIKFKAMRTSVINKD